ncbi:MULTISPECIES: hypothetical protein [Stenotrophomonas]|uniref:hypothetical protein n=1 Tax=Stenotrophomonas TaxID=40323 RepID=UPI000872302D|nr:MULTISPECIES: hypothetical protein [Stenotrophomonas]OEZ02319.1 hypothetical protein BIY45_01975 [Stenotrophomonas sp. BIIR7]
MSPKPPNLHLVSSNPTPNEGELQAMRDAITRMKRNRALLDEFCAEQARFVRAEYLSYVEAGFTRPQAMQLVAAKLGPGRK